MNYESNNPYTEECLEKFDFENDESIDSILQKLNGGFEIWRKCSFNHRATLFLNLSKMLTDQLERCSTTISIEMGKPIAEARREIQKCCRVIDYFVKETPNLLHSIARPGVSLHPLGVVLGIMPWNFPFWQALRLLIPTLLMGNTCLIKHAPNVPQSIQLLINLMHQSGFDESTVNYSFLSNEQVEKVIASHYVVGVSLTGSERAGRAIAQLAGKNLKPAVLELGGSDPFIVCEDANLEEAIETAVAARFGNAGQVCISAKRFIVHQSIKQEFTQGLIRKVSNLRCGDPLDESSQIGPLARKDIKEQIHDQVEKSLNNGAQVLYTHDSLPEKGWFYPPTVLSCENTEAPVLKEETFGPVAVISSFDTREDALSIANNSRYGLGAAVWTESNETADYFKDNIQAGAVFVNQLVKSQPELPFGGIKCSGYGRELGVEGLLAFTNIKLTI